MNWSLLWIILKKVYGMIKMFFMVLFMKKIQQPDLYVAENIIRNSSGFYPEIVIQIIQSEIEQEE